MANKTYFVKKDGEIIKELKSLSAAKKIAQAESADVYCGDELVYSAHGTDKEVNNGSEKEESVSVEKEVNNDTENVSLYVMNVRTSPSLSSRKIATLLPGTIVTVANIKNDWLYLTNGSFILYGNGKYAEKIE